MFSNCYLFLWFAVFALPLISKASGLTLDDKVTYLYGDRYHITLRRSSRALTQMLQLRKNLQEHEIRVEEQVVPAYTGIFTFTAQLRGSMFDFIQNLPYIRKVEKVRPIYFDSKNIKSGQHAKKPNSTCYSQLDADWGLKRISGRANAASGFTYNHRGKGVIIYVIDTGVLVDHKEFEGRAKFGTCVPPSHDPLRPMSSHGTHVAAIAAGKIYGVAKKAKVVSVRITDDEAYADTQHLLAAFSWVLDNHIARANHMNRHDYPSLDKVQHLVDHHPEGYERPKSVINLSFSTRFTEVVELMASRLRDYGITVITSAGNSGTDVCSFSPGASADVITVACSDENDAICRKSNFGQCVNVFAPGWNIRSAAADSTEADERRSGTSQSAPFVSGLVAAYVGSLKHAPTLKKIVKWLEQTATVDRITVPYEAWRTPNKLVFSGCGSRGYNHSYSVLDNPIGTNPVIWYTIGTCMYIALVASIIYIQVTLNRRS